jgi:hypothetical protein
MPLITTYGVHIREKDYGKVLKDTVEVYRKAVDFLISVRLEEKEVFQETGRNREEKTEMERLVHKTKDNPEPKYDFDSRFYKFPSEYRRDAIAKALALVRSYESNLQRWDGKGKAAGPA